MNVDLFSGIRGWGVDGIGFEIDRDACATQAALGAQCVRADIASWPLEQLAGRVRGITASPPCQTFSTAGKGDGVARLGDLLAVIGCYDGGPVDPIDGRTELVVEPLRWALALRPEWLACEQVPAVLPLWHAIAGRLAEHGYSTWAGVLNAADYGVPQTRRRAILLASRVRLVGPPEPTHARDPQPGLFGTRAPWVTMAAALGWTGEVGFPRIDDRGDSADGYRARDWRSTDEPAFGLTEKARSWTVRTGANTMKHGRTADDVEPYERSCDEPSPTVVGSALGKGVWTVTDADERPVKLTVRDALVLQSFPPDWPVQGSRTAQFRQVGNAIPPGLARAALTTVETP